MTVLRPRKLVLAVVAFAASLPATAWAELGGSVSSVQVEQSRMRAGLRHVELGTYTRHELSLPNGGSVHEFSNSGGQVFAVVWHGPGKPDLRSLLGAHFATFQAEAAPGNGRGPHFRRRPMQVNHSDLQIRTGGHMGYFWGVAYLPAQLPAGFNTTALQ